MFEIGFQEILMIALLALIVLGPEKLPKLAAKVGHWTGRARSMARNLRTQLEQEISYEDLLKQKNDAEEALRRAQSSPMDFHAHADAVNDALSATLTPDTGTEPATNPEPPAAEPAAPPAHSDASTGSNVHVPAHEATRQS